jgi:hypothetical protein
MMRRKNLAYALLTTGILLFCGILILNRGRAAQRKWVWETRFLVHSAIHNQSIELGYYRETTDFHPWCRSYFVFNDDKTSYRYFIVQHDGVPEPAILKTSVQMPGKFWIEGPEKQILCTFDADRKQFINVYRGVVTGQEPEAEQEAAQRPRDDNTGPAVPAKLPAWVSGQAKVLAQEF